MTTYHNNDAINDAITKEEWAMIEANTPSHEKMDSGSFAAKAIRDLDLQNGQFHPISTKNNLCLYRAVLSILHMMPDIRALVEGKWPITDDGLFNLRSFFHISCTEGYMHQHSEYYFPLPGFRLDDVLRDIWSNKFEDRCDLTAALFFMVMYETFRLKFRIFSPAGDGSIMQTFSVDDGDGKVVSGMGLMLCENHYSVITWKP